MCNSPITYQDQTFACRRCDDCLATRKNDWVARCMAEKAMTPHCYVLTLTYANVNGVPPENAKAFHYPDVSGFLKRLREAYFQEYGVRGEVRFIVCGELGSRTERAHWHMILFTQRPIEKIVPQTDLAGHEIPFSYDRRVDIGVKWPFGFVYFQKASQGSFSYILKYAFKELFNVERAKGTRRLKKADNHGAGYFRMSKQPPLGHSFLDAKIEEWKSQRRVPVSSNLKIPEYSGFWYPRGKAREKLLLAVHEINEEWREQHGRDAPQMASFMATLDEDNVKEVEIIYYGDNQKEEETEETEAAFNRQRRKERVRRAFEAIPENDVPRKCGRALPCPDCFQLLTKSEEAELWRYYYRQKKAARLVGENLDEYCLERTGCNPFCVAKPADGARAWWESAW